MSTLWATLRTIHLWQAGALACMLAVVVFGGYAMTNVLVGSESAVGDDEQLVPAQIGDLVNQVSTNGIVTFPERELQVFEPKGVLGVLLVNEGDAVTEGQELARLDGATIAKAERALIEAQQALANTGDALAALVDDADARAAAVEARDAALTTLANAGATLAMKLTARDRKVAGAAKLDDEARDAYAAAFRQWLGVELDTAQLGTAPSGLLLALGIDLDALFVTGVGSYPGGLPADDPSTAWGETVVASWSLFPGALFGSCENAQATSQDRCVSDEITAAWDAHQLAADALASAQATNDTAVFVAEQAVNTAGDSLESARDALADAEDGPDALALALAEKNVEIAAIAVDDAQALLGGTTLRATMTGVVGSIMAAVGDTLQLDTAILEVVDPTIVEVEGIIDEIDVLSVAEGVPALVRMDALVGQALQGSVSAIDAGSTSQQGVVSYPIRIRLDVPDGIELREGLSATASIVVSQVSGALLIPTAAVQGTFVDPFVQVFDDGTRENRPVTLGDSDDFWVQVVAGLVEGESVVMDAPDAGSTFTGFGGFGGRLPAGVQPPEELVRVLRGLREQYGGSGVTGPSGQGRSR
jgi:multidrug efflux pump subunit AcrA (membrane-fusion protein)